LDSLEEGCSKVQRAFPSALRIDEIEELVVTLASEIGDLPVTANVMQRLVVLDCRVFDQLAAVDSIHIRALENVAEYLIHLISIGLVNG